MLLQITLNLFSCLMQTYLTAVAMPMKKPLPSNDVLNALFERLIVSYVSLNLGVSDQQHAGLSWGVVMLPWCYLYSKVCTISHTQPIITKHNFVHNYEAYFSL